MGKYRNFIISWNNYPPTLSLEELKERIVNKALVKYLILGKEIGEKEQTPHIQGYVRFEYPQHLTSIRKLLLNDDGTMGWAKQAKGNDLENQIYCSKQGDFIEYGEVNVDESEQQQTENLIDDLLEGVEYKELLKRYRHYVLYHYRDFRKLYLDIKQYKVTNTLLND